MKERVNQRVIIEDAEDGDGHIIPRPAPEHRDHRVRTHAKFYVHTVKGQRYHHELGMTHLCYWGNRHKNKYVILQANLLGISQAEKIGVFNLKLGDKDAPTPISVEDVEERIMGLVLINRYNLKQGLNRFGAHEEEAVNSKLQQTHGIHIHIPMNPQKMTRAERLKASSALLFLVEKRDGKIKARKCVGCSQQCTQEGYKKKD